MTSSSVRIPIADADSAPFWDAVAERRLTAQRCAACSRFVFYPRAICPHCHSDGLVWQPLAGTGTVHSFTVSRRAPSPEFEALVPYLVALIDLDEGCRMLSNIVGADVEEVQCGSRVSVRFEIIPGADGQILPMFELANPEDQVVSPDGSLGGAAGEA